MERKEIDNLMFSGFESLVTRGSSDSQVEEAFDTLSVCNVEKALILLNKNRPHLAVKIAKKILSKITKK